MTTESQEQTQAATPNLNINDLSILAEIISVATKRGTFQANELTNVGQVYDKLTVFLTAIKEQQEAQAKAQADAQPAVMTPVETDSTDVVGG